MKGEQKVVLHTDTVTDTIHTFIRRSDQIGADQLTALPTDEIHPSPHALNGSVQRDIIGGAGTYSAIGARMFSPAPILSRTVAWIVDAGPDFPAHIQETVQSWQTSVLLRPRAGPTTRGWNGYSGNEQRAFKYMTPKKRLTAADLTPAMLQSQSFHLISSAERCIDQAKAILDRRQELHARNVDELVAPKIIWEPVPDCCTADQLDSTYAALMYVDVVSPNHTELAALYGFSHGDDKVVKEVVEEHAQRLYDHGFGRQSQGAIVVRAGAEGCFILTSKVRKWLPAVHRDPKNVVDPTGGGNAFLGAFAVGLVRSGDVVEASRWGSVAASFAIEQVGMPNMARDRDQEGDERWNGASVDERLREFRNKTA